MITRARQDIDFSTFPTSDGEPMAETTTHRKQMVNLIFMLTRLLTNYPASSSAATCSCITPKASAGITSLPTCS